MSHNTSSKIKSLRITSTTVRVLGAVLAVGALSLAPITATAAAAGVPLSMQQEATPPKCC